MKKITQIIILFIISATSHSCCTNILDETVSISEHSYVSVILNSEDPQIMSYYNGNLKLGFYGEKSQGLPTKLRYVSYKERDGNVSLLRFNSQGQISSFIGSNQVSISFRWNQNNCADIIVSDPSTDLYIYSICDFSNYSIISKANLGNNTNSQNEGTQLPIQIQRKGIPCAADVVLKVMLDSVDSYLLGNETAEGLYKFQIPNYSRVVTGNQLLFRKLCTVFGVVYSSLNPISMIKDSIKEAIEKDIESSAIKHTPSSIMQTVTCFLDCLDAVVYVSDITRTESSFINQFNPVLTTIKTTEDIYVLPLINGTVYNNYKYKIPANQIHSPISIELDDAAVIDEIELRPFPPLEGDNYNLSFRYQCVPVGSLIEVKTDGSDGYTYSTSAIASNNVGYMSINIPGTYSGVQELCTFNIIYKNVVLKSIHVLFRIY